MPRSFSAAGGTLSLYRIINPTSHQELPLRMLFQPAGEGLFYRACEADTFRGLVAAMLDEPDYEIGDPETRLVSRLRLADDIALIAQVEGRNVNVRDTDHPESVNVASDESFIRTLDRLGFVSIHSESR